MQRRPARTAASPRRGQPTRSRSQRGAQIPASGDVHDQRRCHRRQRRPLHEHDRVGRAADRSRQQRGRRERIAQSVTSGETGTFPPSENFDEAFAPALPDGWIDLDDDRRRTTGRRQTRSRTPRRTRRMRRTSAPSTATHARLARVHAGRRARPSRSATDTTSNAATTARVLEISINGGAFADIVSAGGRFITGGYALHDLELHRRPLGRPLGVDRRQRRLRHDDRALAALRPPASRRACASATADDSSAALEPAKCAAGGSIRSCSASKRCRPRRRSRRRRSTSASIPMRPRPRTLHARERGGQRCAHVRRSNRAATHRSVRN